MGSSIFALFLARKIQTLHRLGILYTPLLLGYNEKPLTLQMFIGTADERNLRPHAFYQVHRITGKMVATPSYEALVGSTKVLEMSLLPENSMCANIDCAGILKLRNSDIELRKGETDIGRKNTRVRLVFRVHIPQGGGKGISLQVASIPIECSQRSAQELPQVENYSLSACSVNGCEELLLCGSNFLSDSKVVFIEKGPDGKLQWEEEAKVNRLKSNESLLSVQVPEYCNKDITRPLQVYFYISNGRRKRSPMQSFRYLPVIFKEEPLPEMTLHRFSSTSLPSPSHLTLDPGHMELSTSFVSPPNLSEAPMEVSPYYISQHQERMFSGASDCSASSSSFLGCYFNPTVLPELKCPPSYPENGGDMSIGLPFHTSNSALPPSPVPWSPQPCSSNPTSTTTFGGSLLPHLNTNNKLEERGTGTHTNYHSSILQSLEFERPPPHFVPGYQSYTTCAPPTYTTLGEIDSIATMHSKQSSTSPEISRIEQCSTNQQFTLSRISNHPSNPAQPLRSKIDDIGSPSHTGFSISNSSLSISCKDGDVTQTFSSNYHNLSSCSTTQLTTLCSATHPSPFSSSSSPIVCNTPDSGQKGTSDTATCTPSNQNEKDSLEEYSKSANNEGGDVRKEHNQVFENPFHPIPIQGITLEEVSEFIGQDLHSFPERHQN
ncbi:hypothetical protein GDO81_001900 [Engystomops pustulosus]|uniref:RHD domain-containing protein n=2 Tax=Engystomops pustulosus TaxID=76066 RepID=A0AAV7DG10_ENGPU|nr:hypothetical protein GDO81_001900 [Engystomops pustulosus]